MDVNQRRKVYKERRDQNDEDYRTLFRFNRENEQWLTNHFLNENNETRGGALTNEQRMKIFLRYLSDPGFQSGVAEDIRVDQSIVSITFSQVLEAIRRKAHLWIKFPATLDEMQAAMNEWRQRYNFPHVLGVIDCTHVQIKRPHQDGDEYINRKGVHTINIQVTCNAQEKFTSVDVSLPGSVHDSRIWSNSNIRTMLYSCRISTNTDNDSPLFSFSSTSASKSLILN